MATIRRIYTTITNARIDTPIDDERALSRALHELGSHYMDPDTRRFFGSRIAQIWPMPDGAVWTETTKGPSYNSQRWTYARRLIIHTQGQIDAGEGTHDIETIYKDQGDASARTAKASATAAARKAYTDAKEATQ